MFTRYVFKVCDGPGLSFPFVGRRAVESRDVSVHCCKEDFCNYPKELRTTTTPVPATVATGKLQSVSFLIKTTSLLGFGYNIFSLRWFTENQ